MAWHSDDEAELGPETVIASVSFGATRKFAFRHRHTRQKVEMLLHHGQLTRDAAARRRPTGSMR